MYTPAHGHHSSFTHYLFSFVGEAHSVWWCWLWLICLELEINTQAPVTVCEQQQLLQERTNVGRCWDPCWLERERVRSTMLYRSPSRGRVKEWPLPCVASILLTQVHTGPAATVSTVCGAEPSRTQPGDHGWKTISAISRHREFRSGFWERQKKIKGSYWLRFRRFSRLLNDPTYWFHKCISLIELTSNIIYLWFGVHMQVMNNHCAVFFICPTVLMMLANQPSLN